MTDSPIIQAKNIAKIYNQGQNNEVQAIRDVSLEIKKGEFVCIMGASGSGKSTLMNILGCLDKATSGTLVLDGVEVSRLDDEELARIRGRKLGFVFQMFNLLPRTTALENTELPLIYSDRSNITKLARETLEAVGLDEGRMHHFPSELSGGEQQRVAIARALVNSPEIVFADEPTGNLDTRSSYEIISLFQKLNEQGKTVVLVTHEQDIAEHTRRIIKISDGKIVADFGNENMRMAEHELAKLAEKGGA